MNFRLVTSLGVYLLWVIITVAGAKLMLGGETAGLDELVKNGIGWQFVGAVALLFAAIAIFKWRDMAFVSPHSLFKVMWFPVLVLLVMSSISLITGMPAGKTMAFVAFNTFLVGLSEEVMFRGVLYRALLSNYRIWTAIIVTSVLFGAVHVLNVFTTGELGPAMLQATAAGMSGMLFVAIVVRTGSIWPAIIYHWLWDCVLFLLTTGSAASGVESDPSALEAAGTGVMFLPLLLALPNFLCALVLLRKVRDADYRAQPAAAA